MTDEELIQLLAAAARIACRAVTRPRQAALQASVDQASAVPAEFGWDRKAAAHAGFFTALADAAGDPRAAPVLNYGAGFAYDLMISAGWAADGIIANSHKRLLDHVRTGDTDQAALEMEKHLRVLRFMHRLASAVGPPKPAKLSKPALDPELGRRLWDVSAEPAKVRPSLAPARSR